MHFLGFWSVDRLPDTPRPTTRVDQLALYCDEHVTSLQDEIALVFYEGVIFDRRGDELLQDPSALEEAYGLYTYAKFDKSERTLVIGTDKLGFSPLYYARLGGGLVFSTCLQLVKQYLPSVSADYEAWDELLNLGSGQE